MCIFGYTYLLSHPLLQIIIIEVLIHCEKKRREALCL